MSASVTWTAWATGFTSSAGASVCSPIWGDGLIVGTEACDDWNSSNNDGCSTSCTIEAGFNCSRSAASSCDTCTPIWGDSKKMAPYEQCEDGNTANGDGWDSTWHLEPGYSWTGGTTNSIDVWNWVWGDGKRMGSEQWDDQNIGSGDGCSKSCTVEVGFKWKGGSSTSKDSWDEIWGDGIVIYDTEANCDDGNFIDGDGWSSTCRTEAGWTWSGGTPKSPDICKTTWGDGVIAIGIEEWDDGNTKSFDGCSTYWKFEDGFICKNNYLAAINTYWYEIWGDGKKYGVNPWDDGNIQNGDGWNSTWFIETGYKCQYGTPTMKDTWSEICGDSKYYGGNECDDGNIIDNDGWSSTCELEKCYQWVGGSLTSKDTWSILYITPNITSISTDNTITISFNHAMNKTSITLKDLQVTINTYYNYFEGWRNNY